MYLLRVLVWAEPCRPQRAPGWSAGVSSGVLVALGRSTSVGLLALGGRVAIAVLGAVAVTWVVDRWAALFFLPGR